MTAMAVEGNQSVELTTTQRAVLEEVGRKPMRYDFINVMPHQALRQLEEIGLVYIGNCEEDNVRYKCAKLTIHGHMFLGLKHMIRRRRRRRMR